MSETPPRHPEPSFAADVAAAWHVWVKHPLLPIVTALLWLPYLLPEPLAVLALPTGIFLIGWNGTQRIWYLRSFRGGTIEASEAWRFTWRFFGRHLVVGLVIGAPIMLAFTLVPSLRTLDQFEEGAAPTSVVIAASLATLVLDVVLTFVMPALAYSTRRVGEALRIGLRMLRTGWPGHVAYVLVPPLALVSLSQLTESRWGAVASLASMAVGLLMKGAIAAYYLRRHDVGDDGTAVRRHAWDQWDSPPIPPSVP
ncbi:MAG TPA: hypothetical protein VGB64_04425 [Actinomycetota bacterium]